MKSALAMHRFWRKLGLFCLLISGPLAGFGRQTPGHKLAPGLTQAQRESQPATYRIAVTNATAFRKWAAQHLPEVSLRPSGFGQLLLVSGVDAAALARLTASELVLFVDVPNRPAREERELAESDLTANRIATVHQQLPQLNGAGLVVSVKERPFDTSDLDLRGRIIPSPALTAESATVHASTMATLIAGAGNTAPSGRGAAFRAGLVSASYANLLPDDGPTLASFGVSVQNHSYGVSIENYYGLEAQAYDQQTQDFPGLLHVFSSGNSGDGAGTGAYAGLANFANLTGQFKTSKNTLSVGAINLAGQLAPRSSRGPAHDGRLKPELVAYGAGGTSESAALLSGIALLVQQAHQQQTGNLPPAALVKAVLLNSARDLGSPGPDFGTGFGTADALAAVQTMRQGQVFTDNVANGGQKNFSIEVPPGQHRLKVTLAWADPAAAANASRALVNDLDLQLTKPGSGENWQPWVLNPYPHLDSLRQPARRGVDRLNNVEQITVDFPSVGTYQMAVAGFAVPAGPQTFHLAYAFEAPGFTWVSPVADTSWQPGIPQPLRWQWNGPARKGRISYRLVGSAEWQLAADSVELDRGYIAWTPPDTVGLIQMRVAAASFTSESEVFLLARPLVLRVGFVCNEEKLLYWAPVAAATQYQVYQLNDKALEPLVMTADTLLLLGAANRSGQYYAVAPVIQGVLGERSFITDVAQGAVGCYIRSFLPRRAVTDSVILDLELGATYRLQSVTLERKTASGFLSLQTVSPVTQLSTAFGDLTPIVGRNVYRIRLETQNGEVVYSGEEEVYYTPSKQWLLFPNPLAVGERLQVVGSTDETVALRLYDPYGRLVRQITDDASIKTLSTEGLGRGLYVVQGETASGETFTQRLVLY